MPRKVAGVQRACLVTLLAAMVLSSAPVALAGEGPAGAVGHTAPAFSRMDLAGRRVRLTSYRGKVVLLNFWATWCGPCLTEMPRFVEWQRQMAGLQVVGVSMDDEAAPVRAAYAKYKLNYPVVMGDAALGRLYDGVYGLPVTLVIDRAGVVRFRHRGAADLPVLHREIEGLMARP